MGAALANRLLNCGKDIIVWNRTAGRKTVQDLVARGARLGSDVTDTIKPCTTVIFCVLGYCSLNSILVNIDPDSLKGKTVVNLTNGTVSEAREMSETMLQSYGVGAYLDGAIMTTPKLVSTEASFLFCSGGEPGAFEGETKTLLQHFGRVDYLGSDPGAAALHDLALLAAMYGMFDGTLTVIGLLAKHQLSSSIGSSEKSSIVATV